MERNSSDDNNLVTRRPAGAAVFQADVTNALTRAFFKEWARVGFAAISLERVAKNAGAGKAAIYRRWSSKVNMASDLLSKVGIRFTDLPDKGSLEADLLAFLCSLSRVLRHSLIRRILIDLHAETEHEPLLKAAIQPFIEARRKRVMILIDRAIARREVPQTIDIETAADFMVSALYWRLVVIGGSSDNQHLEPVARMVAAAMRVGSPNDNKVETLHNLR